MWFAVSCIPTAPRANSRDEKRSRHRKDREELLKFGGISSRRYSYENDAFDSDSGAVVLRHFKKIPPEGGIQRSKSFTDKLNPKGVSFRPIKRNVTYNVLPKYQEDTYLQSLKAQSQYAEDCQQYSTDYYQYQGDTFKYVQDTYVPYSEPCYQYGSTMSTFSPPTRSQNQYLDTTNNGHVRMYSEDTFSTPFSTHSEYPETTYLSSPDLVDRNYNSSNSSGYHSAGRELSHFESEDKDQPLFGNSYHDDIMREPLLENSYHRNSHEILKSHNSCHGNSKEIIISNGHYMNSKEIPNRRERGNLCTSHTPEEFFFADLEFGKPRTNDFIAKRNQINSMPAKLEEQFIAQNGNRIEHKSERSLPSYGATVGFHNHSFSLDVPPTGYTQSREDSSQGQWAQKCDRSERKSYNNHCITRNNSFPRRDPPPYPGPRGPSHQTQDLRTVWEPKSNPIQSSQYGGSSLNSFTASQLSSFPQGPNNQHRDIGLNCQQCAGEQWPEMCQFLTPNHLNGDQTCHVCQMFQRMVRLFLLLLHHITFQKA